MKPGEGNPIADLLWFLIFIIVFFFVWLRTIGPQEDPGGLFLEREDIEKVQHGL